MSDNHIIPKLNDGTPIVGVPFTTAFSFDFGPLSAHRFRVLLMASAIVGDATVELTEILGDFNLAASGPHYPADVNTDERATFPSLAAAFSPVSKVFDRFISASGKSTAAGSTEITTNKLRITITPGTSITLGLAQIHLLSYSG